ncbi:MAG: hypothetical protein ABS910_09570 [Arthrobacter sp.]
MREPKYADVPAARHMRVPDSAVAPEGGAGSPEDIPETGPVRPSDSLRPDYDASYRRKRLVAGVLSGMVFLSVPALIVLLVLFG